MAINTISYPETFSQSSKKVQVSTGQKSIEECLALLLTSARGELLGDPQYGTKLLEYVYNYVDNVLFELLKTEIVRAISTYEHRIIVSEQDINIIDDGTKVKISILYYIKDEGEFTTFTLELERQASGYEY